MSAKILRWGEGGSEPRTGFAAARRPGAIPHGIPRKPPGAPRRFVDRTTSVLPHASIRGFGMSLKLPLLDPELGTAGSMADVPGQRRCRGRASGHLRNPR